MSDKRQAQIVDWAFRLLIVAFVGLWVIYPPHKAVPQIVVSATAGVR